MRSAGRTLTVGELLAELAGSDPNLPFRLASGHPIQAVEARAGEVLVTSGAPDTDDTLDAIAEFLDDLGAGAISLKDAKEQAKALLADWSGVEAA